MGGDCNHGNNSHNYISFCFVALIPKVHPKTKIQDQDELASLLQVPLVVSESFTFFTKQHLI